MRLTDDQRRRLLALLDEPDPDPSPDEVPIDPQLEARLVAAARHGITSRQRRVAFEAMTEDDWPPAWTLVLGTLLAVAAVGVAWWCL